LNIVEYGFNVVTDSSTTIQQQPSTTFNSIQQPFKNIQQHSTTIQQPFNNIQQRSTTFNNHSTITIKPYHGPGLVFNR
jgi:ferritin